MQEIIRRAEVKINEILKLCEDIKKDLNTNNAYQKTQRIPTDELNCRKLLSCCDQIFRLLQSSHLTETSGNEKKVDYIFRKGSLSNRDVDDVYLIFDKHLRGLDNLKFAMIDSSQPIMQNENVILPKIFISHSTQDSEYAKALVELLESIGIKENQLFCSSITEYGIHLNADIYEFLKTQFKDFALQVIFLLSDEYYKSAACLNEMGAAWVLRSDYTTILLPNFEFKNIRGAINPNRIGIKLDSQDTSARLNELKDNMVKIFKLEPVSQTKWERHRTIFMDKIRNIQY